MSEKSMKLSLVARILAKFKIGDEGKYNSFFLKLIKDEERAISELKHNINAEKLYHTAVKELLENKIEDAENVLDNVYLEVNPEEIQTNAQQEEFKKVYWTNIDLAEKQLTRLTKELTDVKENHERTLKEINEQISKRQARIAKINK